MQDDWVPAGYTPNRELQNSLLRRMQAVYPDRLATLEDLDWPIAVAQLSYLEGHGLCDAGLLPNMVGYSWRGCRITEKGLDFLADDGGLSSIFGVITIKLHANTVRSLLADRVNASNLPEEKKSQLKTALGKLSTVALQAVTTDLAKMGLEHGPDALGHLERLASGLM